MSVLSEARSEFRDGLTQAYRNASQSLEEVKGEEVELVYPYEEGEASGARTPEVTGTVENVEVGEIPSQNVKFTTCITFEDGRTFTDAENIKILS
jgi:hypothetical protein